MVYRLTVIDGKVKMDKEEFIKQEQKDFEEEREKAIKCLNNLKENIDDDWLADFSSCSMRMDAINNRIQGVIDLRD